MMMVRVAVTGSTGLVGECMVRLLLGHPDVEVTYLGSNSSAGRDIGEVLPSLRGAISMTCKAPDADDICGVADVAILAHKSAESLVLTPKLLDAGVKVIDIGGEFRLKDPALYQKWYGQEHTAPDTLSEAVYGLPELYRDRIRSARLVANPGCYPTSVVLALAPLLAKGLVARDGIRISSSSGLSGAGRTSGKLFIDVHEDMRAYALSGHKHRPEMEQELTAAAGGAVSVTFVPHIVPVNRGILTTIFARPAVPVNQDKLRETLSRRYADEPFVRVRDWGGEVCMTNVRGTNFCDVAVQHVESTDDVIVVAAIDNMLKGACTQAVQNMNLMCGLDEAAGIGGVRGS
jgi:N-acetyl-gamma-glutamyl-phosphate reductase